jgi:glucosamine 6-phosphate synthetase-like amidotransferase/phosphosugar isomerase protein
MNTWVTLAQAFIVAGGGAVVLAVVNATFSRAARKADPAKMLVEGSVAHTQALLADTVRLNGLIGERDKTIEKRDQRITELSVQMRLALRYIEDIREDHERANLPMRRMPEDLWVVYKNRL